MFGALGAVAGAGYVVAGLAVIIALRGQAVAGDARAADQPEADRLTEPADRLTEPADRLTEPAPAPPQIRSS